MPAVIDWLTIYHFRLFYELVSEQGIWTSKPEGLNLQASIFTLKAAHDDHKLLTTFVFNSSCSNDPLGTRPHTCPPFASLFLGIQP